MKVVVLVLISIFVILGGWFGLTYVNIFNQDVSLHTQFSAETDNNKVIFDKTWKVVKEKAGVADQAAEQFKDIYTKIMDARYSGKDNLLMNWIKEQNPQFDISLYKDLSLSIESNKAEFLRCQQKLIDLNRVHENLRQKFPTNIFLGIKGCKAFEVKLVTSTKTEKAFETGKDDDVDLFNKNKK